MGRGWTWVLTCLTIVAFLGGCFDAPAEDEEESTGPVSPVPLDEDGFSAVLSTGWTYADETHTSDLVDHPVQMEVYLPDPKTTVAGAELPETFPTLLMASPYWGNGVGPELDFNGYPAYEGLLHRLIERGYAIVLGDSASMGGSGGCWDFMGPVDVAGSLALVDVITQQPWSNGKVAMHGLSYDGMTQIMAASHAPEGLVTVIPAAPLTHAYAGLYQGGVHYGGGWHATAASYTSSAATPPTAQSRQGGWLDSVASTPDCADTNVQANDPTGQYNAYFRARDFRPLAPDVDASVFYIQGFFDAAVKPDNFGAWFQSVPTAKKAWLGWWPHTYPAASQGGRDDLILTLHRWLDHELVGVPNGILDDPVVDVQDSEGVWRHEDAWPPRDATPWTLQLGSDRSLVEEGAQEGTVTVGMPTDAYDAPGVTDTVARLSYEATEDARIVGRVYLNATVSSDRAGGYLVARLWDVGDDQRQPVTKGAISLRVKGAESPVTGVTPNVPVPVSLEMYPTDYVLRAGHSLQLELVTQDSTQWYDPDAEAAILTVRTGDDTSVLDMHTVVRDDPGFLVGCGPSLGRYHDCYEEDLEDRGIDH